MPFVSRAAHRSRRNQQRAQPGSLAQHLPVLRPSAIKRPGSTIRYWRLGMAAGSRLWWPLSCGYGPLQFAHSRLFELSLDVLRRVANEINPTCRALQLSVIAVDSVFWAVVRPRKQVSKNPAFVMPPAAGSERLTANLRRPQFVVIDASDNVLREVREQIQPPPHVVALSLLAGRAIISSSPSVDLCASARIVSSHCGHSSTSRLLFRCCLVGAAAWSRTIFIMFRVSVRHCRLFATGPLPFWHACLSASRADRCSNNLLPHPSVGNTPLMDTLIRQRPVSLFAKIVSNCFSQSKVDFAMESILFQPFVHQGSAHFDSFTGPLYP